MSVLKRNNKKSLPISPLGKREPSQRQLRVAQILRQMFSEILLKGDVLNPHFPWHGVIVTEIVLSADLKLATLYVRHLFSEQNTALLSVLESEKKRLKQTLAPRLGLRYMPELRFRLDTAFDQALRIETLLNSPEVKRDLETSSSSEKDSGGEV